MQIHIIILFIAHFLGDFVLQSSKLAQQKNEEIKYLYYHCIIYSAIFLVSMLLFESEYWLFLFLGVSLSHFIIDYIRVDLIKKNQSKDNFCKIDLLSFIFDQSIHFIVILFISLFITGTSRIGSLFFTLIYTYIYDRDVYNALVIVLLLFISTTPSAILIKKVLSLYVKDEERNGDKNLNNSGYLIGILERIIMLMLGLVGQVGAIGFVIAAKSLARFKQLEDRTFAERYLLGTLLSVAIALFCIIIGNILIK